MVTVPPAERVQRPRLFWAGVVAAVAVGVYLNALSGGFVYDDTDQVVANEWIRDPRHLGTIFTTGVWDFAGTRTNYYRPLMHLVYLATHSAFGLWAPGFHAVSLAFHAAVSVLVFLVAARMLRSGATTRRALAIPALAGLLFAAHPAHTEVVAWIAGIPDLSASLFALLALHLYVTADGERMPSLAPRYVGAVACYFVALLGKEVALLLPGVLLAHDLLFRPESRRRAAWAKRQLPFAAAAALYLALRLAALGSVAPVARFGELSHLEVALNVLPLVALYVQKMVVPVGLNAAYDFHPVTSLLDARTLALTLGGLAVLAAGALFLARGHRRAFLSCALGLLTLAPVLYLPALGEHPFADRYTYLPSAGLVLLLALGADSLLALRPRLAPAVFPAATLAVGGLAAMTMARNPVWKSDLALWRDTAERSPRTALVHYNLGVALQAEGLLDQAIVEYRRAVALEPGPLAFNNLGVACRDAGRTAEAIAALRLAIEMDPRYAGAQSNLALAYLEDGRAELAVEHLRTAVALAPGNADYLNNLGTAYREAGFPGLARQWYEASLRANPGHATARRNLEKLLAR